MTLRSLASRAFAASAAFGADKAVFVALIGLGCAILGGYRAQHLRIDSDFRALIPHHFPSVQNIDELERRVGSLTELVVEVRSPDRDSNIRFGTELATRLEALDGRFRWVEVRRETEWFEKHALLFLSLHELLDLRDRVVRRIRKEVQREVVSDLDDTAAATGGGNPPAGEDDPLDLDDDPAYENSIPGEYLEASDDREHLLVVRGLPMLGTTDMGFTEGLVSDVETAIATTDPAGFHPEMTASIRGGYHDFRVEMNSVKTDIFDAGLVALGLLLLVLIIQYKRIRVLPLLLVPLVTSVLMTVAVATWLYSALNIIAGFIFVVLLGLGIDFGIHLLSRYEFERLRGLGQRAALVRAGATTGVDVATGAATSVVVFLLFTIAEFRGYSQFGALAAIGVTLAFLAMLFLMPAFVVLYERFRPWKPKNWLPLVPPPAETELGKHRLLASVVVFISLSAALASLATTERVPFEYDLSKLGKNLDAPTRGDSLHWSDAIGHPDVGPAMVLGATGEQARFVERQFRGLELLTDAQLTGLAGRELTEFERRDADPEPPSRAPEFDGLDDDEDDDDPFGAVDPFAKLRTELQSGGLAEESKELLALYPIGRVLAMRRFLHNHLSLWTFIPRRQADKLLLIADMRRRLDAKWSALTPETQKKAQRLVDYTQVTSEVTLADIPQWLTERWSEGKGQGEPGRNVILWNRGNKADGVQIRQLQAAFGDLAAGPDGGTVPIAATYLVLPDILDAVVRDGPRILLAALFGVLLWLFAMFRSARLVVLILVPLASAIAWLAGLFFLFGWKINIYNIVTFAVLIGIGVDHGIHMVGRWVEDGGRSVRMAVRETGVAIASTSVTTAIGFGGMVVGGHRGLASLGSTAAAGIMLVFLAAMTTLPALLHLFGRRSTELKEASE